MAETERDIWFREVRPGKWTPVNAKGYAAMIGPHIILMLLIFVPPLIVNDGRFGSTWAIGALVIGLPISLGTTFWLAYRHSQRSH